jgi:hypothetical protein
MGYCIIKKQYDIRLVLNFEKRIFLFSKEIKMWGSKLKLGKIKAF